LASKGIRVSTPTSKRALRTVVASLALAAAFAGVGCGDDDGGGGASAGGTARKDISIEFAFAGLPGDPYYKEYGIRPPSFVPTGPSYVTEETAEEVIELSKKGIR
jgi:hypothetical protein